jgi:hypothetical protein
MERLPTPTPLSGLTAAISESPQIAESLQSLLIEQKMVNRSSQVLQEWL